MSIQHFFSNERGGAKPSYRKIDMSPGVSIYDWASMKNVRAAGKQAIPAPAANGNSSSTQSQDSNGDGQTGSVSPAAAE